ncbi:hypothetical protein C6503_03365 [Candidatus Poribacteria bacterium]|nr:MAG: hypothetical protein C6503_03365 [Candidatus Poribacteria bacterium]
MKIVFTDIFNYSSRSHPQSIQSNNCQIEPEEIISRESSLLKEAEDTLAIEHIKRHYDSARMPISAVSEETIRQITSPDRINIAKQSIQAWGNLIPDVTSRESNMVIQNAVRIRVCLITFMM